MSRQRPQPAPCQIDTPDLCCPIIASRQNIAMHRRIRPRCRRRDQTVFDRVLPAIAQMIGEIGIILDMMFPKPALPDGALCPSDMTGAPRRHRQAARKARFDQTPARAEISIIARHGPDTMHMIWQHHPSINPKGMFHPRQRHSAAQSVNLIAQQGRSPIGQCDRKEDRRPC